ncbi:MULTISPECIES: hybrid sensor histidine kinase/response regulator [Bradyrhizobium]|uniref:hybrid sensor histidine kinase/response regulator n=1 Tax=Bradyrhizobium TaxID=374 RepID=UPI00155EC050|nr:MULTISPECIES: hybrid sensor histidine kinase/response regulator [Bradyrhizobium]MDD1521957.1 hybrid sensor histidine kinase/response regulator [Bradyrhizobium sp. WBAH30]MDD1545480.1 hybrid sensor histidine kinase/response regulator [Bradyrhizobium sp. WBAH41]MDD1558705.1 hybrid sensor histidine kinase/response regulator [Bradyrhizobium sp. WBAH23]MDD1567988.1 hybrid sensor histidine kinase/response regulator [Bradyrhizobium sp. WBAH33]MDD1593099.1 hybrid sensor histidine kinase/response re
MQRAQRNSLRLLQWMMAASLALPIALFAVAAAISYTSTKDTADREIERTVDVAHEHALKVFETIDRSLAELNEVVRGLPDDVIRTREPTLHRRLKRLSDSLPQLKSAWIFDANGKALVNSLVSPPPDLSFADRDYFYAHVDQSIGTFIGTALTPRPPYQGARFFGVSRRRESDDGRFIGVIQASVLPEYFESFYARIGSDPGSFLAMGRTDGAMLTHFPRLDHELRLDPTGPVGQKIAAQPQHGLITVAWPSDGIERRIAYRRVAEYPIYVSAGLETSAIRARWLATIGQHLVFGIPATALLFLLLALALRRTQHLQAEAAKRREAEEALKHSQRLEALGQLTGGVAHDFNNLLTVIRASVDLLNRPQLTEERRQRYITAIADSVARAAKLTSQLLAFARRQTLKPEVFDVGARVQSLHDMLATLLGPAIEIVMQLPAEPCLVNADASQFETALINMATNARDAMQGQGRIVFKVEATTAVPDTLASTGPGMAGHGFVRVTVSDTGVGIPAARLGRIFEPFFTTKQVGHGTGLGLSQVFGFARQSGGEVTVTSEVGRGSTFSLYLPRVPPDLLPQRQAPNTAPAVAGSGMSVLVVEDNIELANFAADGLTELGYSITLIDNATDALAELVVDADRFDVVFSDVVMPGMTGLDLAQAIRDRSIGVPVVLTTGYSQALSQEGVAGFDLVQKPYSIEELSRVLHRAARIRRVRDGAAE